MARRGRVIDNKEWTAIPGLSASVSTDTTTLGGNLSFNVPATILRMRSKGGFFAFDSTQQVGDAIALTWGIGLFSQDAIALGATALPDPGSEPEFPWLMWGGCSLQSFLAAGVNAWGVSACEIRPWDSKAMRKVKPGQGLAVVIQTEGAAGAPVTVIQYPRGRVLIGT